MPINEFKTNIVSNPVTVSPYIQEFTVAALQPAPQSFNFVTNNFDNLITNNFDNLVTNDE